MKRIISFVAVLAIITSVFTPVLADSETVAIQCTQSTSFMNSGSSFVLNTSGKETTENVYWCNTSGQWKGVAVLEFTLPPTEADRIKSAGLSYSVHNGAERAGKRTYDIYASDIEITDDTAADALQTIELSESMFTGEGVAKGETRVDTASGNAIRDYIKDKANTEAESKVQFAFSNSTQPLDIDPSTAVLNLELYTGGIALEQNELTLLSADEPWQLNVKYFDDSVTEADVVWLSDNNEVATVENGLVTPHSAGEAVVTVKTPDGTSSDTCIVTVKQSAEEIVLDKSNLELLTTDDGYELSARIMPENSVERKIEWSSDNEAVIAVSDNGIITPVHAGTATITATNGHISAQCSVTVSEAAEPESVSLDKDIISLVKLGSTAVVNAEVYPENADSTITWTTSDETVAKVIDGVVISGEVGEAVITATTSNGLKAQCTVKVNDDKRLITNDTFYKDTDGNFLFSQGGGIFRFGDLYYWYGVRYTESVNYANNPTSGKDVGCPVFEAITCYTSKDFVNWEYRGDVATVETLEAGPCDWVGRLGVVYHEGTGKYVLVVQYNYETELNDTMIAISESPLGPFKMEKIYYMGDLPIVNASTGDQTMYEDDDGKDYMICSSASGRRYLYVIPLKEDVCDFDFDNMNQLNGSTSQYFDEDGSVQTKDKLGIEGDCLFKYKGNYYFTGSDLYGWNGSRAYVFQADSILGDYNIKPSAYNISAEDSEKRIPYIMKNVKNNYAHNSQTGFYYTIHGSEQETVIYCGDRWSSFGCHGIGFNQWVPLSFEGENNTPVFNDLSQWRLNEETGEWSVAEGNNYLANPAFEADRIVVRNITGWENLDNAGGEAGGNMNSKPYSGSFSAKHSAPVDYSATLKQTVKDLPDGTYTLRASVLSSGGQNTCELYAKNGDRSYTKSLKAQTDGWTEIVIKNIEVTGGECEIGLFSDSTAGNYVRIDDMFLTKNTETAPLMLADADGNMVTDLKRGMEVHAAAHVKKDVNAHIYMAVYDSNGSLKAVKTAITNGNSGAKTESITVQEDTHIKLFMWNENMEPICNAVEVTI